MPSLPSASNLSGRVRKKKGKYDRLMSEHPILARIKLGLLLA